MDTCTLIEVDGVGVKEEDAELDAEVDCDEEVLGSKEGVADALALLLVEGEGVIDAIGDESLVGGAEAEGDGRGDGKGEVEGEAEGGSTLEGEGIVEGVVDAVTPDPQFSCST